MIAVDEHTDIEHECLALCQQAVGRKTVAERSLERRSRGAQIGHALLEAREQVALAHTRAGGADDLGQRTLRQTDRGADAIDLGRELPRASGEHQRLAVHELSLGEGRAQQCVHQRCEAVDADPACGREPGKAGQQVEEVRRVPRDRIQVLEVDVGRHAVVGDAQQVNVAGLVHQHAARRERARPRQPQAPGTRDVTDVRLLAEDERVDLVPGHRGQRATSSFRDHAT